MAIITVSNTGGNYSSTSTWVGGVVPLATDSIAFTSTSGDLTLDTDEIILGIDFTNYLGTFTIPTGAFGLHCLNDGIIDPFINMGTGLYNLVDGGGNNGFDINSSNGNSVILINNPGKSFPFRFEFFGLGYLITGNWVQEGPIIGTSFYLSSPSTGTFTIAGTQNLVTLDMGSEISSIICNGNITADTINLYGEFKKIGGTLNIDTLTVNGDAILDLPGAIINNFSYQSILTCTLNATLVLTNFTTTNLDITFDGNYGFNVNNFNATYFGGFDIITLKSGITYNVTDSITMYGKTGNTIQSSIPGVKASLVLGQNINQVAIANVTAIDIDSGNGIQVNNFYGTATNCINWKIWNDNTLPQVSSTF